MDLVPGTRIAQFSDRGGRSAAAGTLWDMAKAIDPFSSAQIARLAYLLDGPTGRELRRDLREVRLPLGSESTKWRMLRESFELA